MTSQGENVYLFTVLRDGLVRACDSAREISILLIAVGFYFHVHCCDPLFGKSGRVTFFFFLRCVARNDKREVRPNSDKLQNSSNKCEVEE